ncbi:hypothetical protein ACFP1I_05610 [Dyadobacter subterraneus]|uniref:Uncharacterized protein n=1 Tax=Dyadobacter subterraneus TaxID=2773304 RepID=A0ABR9WFX0_9BACT|nr:hypothetical protein [Dyadobacter subterraneus]MBE9464393.1 hypothetical protein [Dyadobacter subterraneus]
MKFSRILLVINLSLLSLCGIAQPTKLVIRAKAKDAKFIGTGIGGAYVVVKNDLTGEILAKGLTTGASGNTGLILKTPHKRNDRLTDDKTAKFEATINIDEPTFVTVEVIAPVNRKSSAIKASMQLWLIPGKNIDEEGIVLDMPGFILDILEPQTHRILILEKMAEKKVKIKINLTMLCGCAIIKGGVWDSEQIEVKAIVKKDGVKYKDLNLGITPVDNIFEGILDVNAIGMYEVQVYGYDKITKNTGVDRINFVIQ